MYYTIIKFPFSSVNDHGYTLWVCLNASGDMSNLTDAIAADAEVFRRKPTQTVMGDTIYNFEGTLSGSVKVTDDEREDFWTPLVCSKLSFNMACETFPVWLMEYCNNNRAKVILTKDDAKPHVMWHGYLIAQTLNMTVVRNLMACPMVAVDEVAMAKYMNFKETTEFVTSDHWCSVFGLMEHYHTLHHTRGLSAASPGFEKLYYILNLTHSNRLLWHRNLAIQDGYGTDINDLPGTLMVNLDRWLQDKEATWEECLTELCEYLGVTFAVGSYGLMTNCDAYLLTCPTDATTAQQFVYTFDIHTVVSHSTSMYATLDNPTKLGGNLQITSEPDRYKAVEVTSVPERWKGHEYLTDEHYKEIAPNKQVRFEWGTTQDATNGPFDTYGWHKLVYIKPTTDEENYVTLPDCQDGEGYVMARDGILPYEDLSSCVGLGQPTGGVADSLDFITFKEGATCVKIGGGEIGGVDEDKHLVPFFLILNHMWSNMWNRTPYTMQSSHIADTPFLTLTPFADNGPTHPSERHYLTLSMRVKFIRENMSIGAKSDGSPLHWLWFASPGVGHTMRVLDWQSPAILMPCEDSEYPNFEDPTSIYTGNVAAWNQIYFTARLRVGDHYWNGNSWVTTPATCDIRLWNTTSEVTEVDKYGIRTIETKNYYYTFGSPYDGNTSVDKMTDPKMLVDCRGVSIPNAPLQGQLKLEILGQIRFQNTIPGAQGVANSVPFILIDNVEIGWTDDAELMGKDIELKQKSVMDATSHTKQTLERSIKMASPQVDGFFDNALLFDNGKAWQNLRQVKVQGALPLLFTPEWSILQRLSWQYGSGQLYVELETPVAYDDNVHNIDFTVTNLTEAKGDFMPLRRVFDYTLERMRVKLMRINMAAAV
jgi:hypothetical protein